MELEKVCHTPLDPPFPPVSVALKVFILSSITLKSFFSKHISIVSRVGIFTISASITTSSINCCLRQKSKVDWSATNFFNNTQINTGAINLDALFRKMLLFQQTSHLMQNFQFYFQDLLKRKLWHFLRCATREFWNVKVR